MSSKSVEIEGDLSLILFQLNLNINAKKNHAFFQQVIRKKEPSIWDLQPFLVKEFTILENWYVIVILF